MQNMVMVIQPSCALEICILSRSCNETHLEDFDYLLILKLDFSLLLRKCKFIVNMKNVVELLNC